MNNMASTHTSPDDDGYKCIVDNTRNVTYGSSDNHPEMEEMGSCSSLNRQDPYERSLGEDHWEMNYHEAAIYLEEGRNNEKFDSHPSHPSDLPAYLLVHNSWYYGFDLFFSLILLLLALFEEPTTDHLKLPVGIHGTLELVALTVIGAELALKLRWIGWSAILKHKRTMIKGCTLVIMVVEALVVLIRQSSHFRVTRALRPIFLVDTRAMGGVRRFIRQILQSLPPILDMMALLLFLVCSYTLLGYFLFSKQPNSMYFKTLQDSFVSMFVLLTTANFPDVMMPAYAVSKWYAAFFISYISMVLYVLMNLVRSCFVFFKIGIPIFFFCDCLFYCIYRNTTVEDYYKYSTNTTSALGYYYLNNFKDLLTTGVTLFELTVVNNWFIVMEAYSIVLHPSSRLYFMLFYLFTMVVLTIVVASVLEAFRFRIQYKKQTSKKDEERMLVEEVIIDWNTLQNLVQDPVLLDKLRDSFVPGGVSYYVGRRQRTRDVLQHRMYASEIDNWIRETSVSNSFELVMADEGGDPTNPHNDRLI
ncbi:two pore calcium channel protein 1-like [Agrilus planipennis]|uniref:Two pore calcium channel protein 1-like n=1 Tax=Agrilus planipennis TaxID=224129 RepID=A0A7F5RFS6_AGRPL|nr:two pore calcium channel protein 1-like [Agrilus planipennis]